LLKYFDKIVFDQKELVKITDRRYDNYYDSSKWLARLQTKIPENITLEAILDENAFEIKPKGSSYWFLKVTKNNIIQSAVMGFTHNFIQWI